MPIFAIVSLPYQRASMRFPWIVQESQGHCHSQCIGERGGMQPLHLPTLNWSDPRQVWRLEPLKIRQRFLWKTAFLSLAGQQSLAWMGHMLAIPGSLSQPVFCVGFAGRVTHGLTAGEGSCSENLRQDLPFSASWLCDTASPIFITHSRAWGTFQLKKSPSGKEKGEGAVRCDVTWQHWDGLRGHLSVPSPSQDYKSLSFWKGWSGSWWCQFNGSQLGVSPFLEGLATSLLALWLGRKHSQGWLSNQGVRLRSPGKTQRTLQKSDGKKGPRQEIVPVITSWMIITHKHYYNLGQLFVNNDPMKLGDIYLEL